MTDLLLMLKESGAKKVFWMFLSYIIQRFILGSVSVQNHLNEVDSQLVAIERNQDTIMRKLESIETAMGLRPIDRPWPHPK